MNYGMSTEKANRILLQCDEFMIVYKTLKYAVAVVTCGLYGKYVMQLFHFCPGYLHSSQVENLK